MIQPLLHYPELEHINYSYNFKYSIDIDSKTETIYWVDLNKCIFQGNIGSCLTSIMNKYDLIFDCFSKYINIIQNFTIIDNKDFYKELILIISKYLPDELEIILPAAYPLFHQDIYNIWLYFDKYLVEYYNLLSDRIKEMKHLEIIIKETKKGKFPRPISDFENQLKTIEDIEFYRTESLELLNNSLKQLEEFKDKINNVFLEDKYATTSNTKFFIATDLNIPKSTINFNNALKSKIVNYTYSFNTLSEFFNISIYHIALSGNIITKCIHCNDYFIPKKNNEIYCHKNFGANKTCKSLGKQERYKYKQNNSQIPYKKYYKNIYDRLAKPKYKSEYLKDFDNNYKSLFNKNNSDEEQAQIAINYLIEYDKKFQNEHPILKGPPYKTQQYWKYYKP